MESEGGISLFSTAPSKQKKRKPELLSNPNDGHGAIEAKETKKRPVNIERELGAAAKREAAQELDAPSDPSTSGAGPTTFEGLGVSEWLIKVLKTLGIRSPTEVQRHCIPRALKGLDVIGCAQTGSGKTAAFALPILQKLSEDPYGVYALVLTPTRELAFQIVEQFRAFGAGVSLTVEGVVGGMDMQLQAQALARRPHVVVATPGRLAALIATDEAIRKSFRRLRFLVLDEADRVLEPSFEKDLGTVLSAVPDSGRQTLLFSATMTQSMEELRGVLLSDAYFFQAYEGLRTADRLKEEYILVPAQVKEVYLHYVLAQLEEFKVRSAIVFAATCHSCALLDRILRELGLNVTSLHSQKSQKDRLASLARFKSSQVPLLIATDVASRGLDIPTVDLVVNYDLPKLAQDYVHRVGRTARAGKGGWSLSLVTQYDVSLVQRIEALTGKQLAALELPEKEVLSGITKVYGARREAMLAMADDEILEKKKGSRGGKAMKAQAEREGRERARGGGPGGDRGRPGDKGAPGAARGGKGGKKA